MKFAIYNKETGAIRCAGSVQAEQYARRMMREGEGVHFGKNLHPATHRMDLSADDPRPVPIPEEERETRPPTRPRPTVDDVIAAMQAKGVSITMEDVLAARAEQAARRQ